MLFAKSVLVCVFVHPRQEQETLSFGMGDRYQGNAMQTDGGGASQIRTAESAGVTYLCGGE